MSNVNVYVSPSLYSNYVSDFSNLNYSDKFNVIENYCEYYTLTDIDSNNIYEVTTNTDYYNNFIYSKIALFPSTYKGNMVGILTSIGNFNINLLEKINFGNITSIDTYFSYSSSLKEVYAINATTLGSYAFAGDTSLTKVYLPNVSIIGEYAFSNCNNLVDIDASNISTIGESAFQNCSSLSTLDLYFLTTIGNYAFTNCTNLSTINTTSVTTFNSTLFSGTNITSINLSNASYMDSNAFQSSNVVYFYIDNTSNFSTALDLFVNYVAPNVGNVTLYVSSDQLETAQTALTSYTNVTVSAT
jgi:hypothetical protein